jgi:hypothetical protein
MKSYKFEDFVAMKEGVLDKAKLIVRRFPLTIAATALGGGAMGTAELAKRGLIDMPYASHEEPEIIKPGLPPLKPAKPAKIIKRIEDAGRV